MKSVIVLLIAGTLAHAQPAPVSDQMLVEATRAYTWTEPTGSVLLLEGPVVIQLDRTRLTAGRAVIWLSSVRGSILDQQQAEIALLDDAVVEQGQAKRAGAKLFVSVVVRGSIRVTAVDRIAGNQSDSTLYREASLLRPAPAAVADPTGREDFLIQRPWVLPPQTDGGPRAPGTDGSTVRPREPVSFRADNVQTAQTADDRVAVILEGNVTVFQTRANGDFIELLANRAVVFTTLRSLRSAVDRTDLKAAEDAVDAVYLEDDVRMNFTPAGLDRPEQRLEAQRVYYEFGTDRAVLTEAVLHTIEPQRNLPVQVRAMVMRQLSLGEYSAETVELSTSSFRVPSYSIRADKAYIRQTDTGDPRYGNRTSFTASGSTFHLYGAPIFYWPYAAGTMTDRGGALREVQFGSSRGFGMGVRTTWGLFETFGRVPPRDLDITYHVDYFADRGLSGGIDAEYQGGFVTETTKEPWNFEGRLSLLLASDFGEDRFGRNRRRVDPEDDFRARLFWQHQHFFPMDWQFQAQAGWLSDPTFLESWFRRNFRDGFGEETSIFLKRQRDTEQLSLLFSFNPSGFVTSSNDAQEQFTVDRLPELGFHRVGESVFDDRFTIFSNNTVSALRFDASSATLAEQGYRTGQSPGIPSRGQTGIDDDLVFRGDFRQEIDLPFTAGQFKVVPYLVGRYTPYSDSPEGGFQNRLYAGAGVRIYTAFWRTDESVRSELFDLTRLRHVIEPEIHLFTGVATVERDEVFQYDENIDGINDISGVQLALRQRWQTKRGGPGRKRSVDFFTLNVELNLFANQPDEVFQRPVGFRGIYYPSNPETSLARNSVNADMLWRVSDTTAVLGDFAFNLDEMNVATTSVGLAVQRDPRLTYFAGVRYISQVDSTVGSVAMNYRLNAKYEFGASFSQDLGSRENQSYSLNITRRFDRYFVAIDLYYNNTDGQGGFNVAIYPEGLGYGLSTEFYDRYVGSR